MDRGPNRDIYLKLKKKKQNSLNIYIFKFLARNFDQN